MGDITVELPTDSIALETMGVVARMELLQSVCNENFLYDEELWE
jgi:hypothetical protein